MSRPHPFEIALGAVAPVEFPKIRREATGDMANRLRFLQVELVQDLLNRLVPPEAPESTGALLEELGALLHVAYRYWEAGEPSLEVSRDALLDAAEGEGPASLPAVPGGACYLRLPERLFWTRVGSDAPHEPMDGLFVVENTESGDVTVLAVLGLRPEREGFSQVVVSAPRTAVRMAAQERRRPPFAPVMAGADRMGLRSVVSEAEVLHLASLALSMARR